MTEENAVVQELDKTGTQVDPKESDATGVDPQGTQEQGENEQEKKRKGGWQRRQEKAERERDYWREQALRNAPKPEPEAKVEVKPKPSWQEYESAGKSEQYFEDLADWKAEQKLTAFVEKQKAEAKEREFQTEEQKATERWQESLNDFRTQHSDFDEVMSLAAPSKLLENLVVRNKEGVAIAYHLAKNPELEAQLSRMTNAADIREELGVIRAQLAQPATEADDEADVQAAPAQAKPLPKPPTPIQKSSSVSKRFDPLDPSSYGNDFTAYEKHMNERDKRKAKG